MLCGAMYCVVSVTGCGAGWRRVYHASAGPADGQQQAQVWQRGEYTRLHAVEIRDSVISGVHFMSPTNCVSCRVLFPLAQVDSIRFGTPEQGFFRGVGLVFLAMLGLIAAICGVGGGCYYD